MNPAGVHVMTFLLLTRPELTIKQVADKVGIADPHYFHAIYRQQFGQTPQQGRVS